MAGLRSLRSTWIAYGATALAVIAFNAGTAYDTYGSWPERSAADRASFVRAGIPLQEAFMANAAMVIMLALGAIGAVAISGEYSTGTIRTRFAAVPARRSVMAAKTVVVTAVTTVFGAIVAGTSFGLTAILDGRDAGVSISYPGALRVVVASALLATRVHGRRHGHRLRHQADLGQHDRLGGGHPRAAHRLHRRRPLVGGRRACTLYRAGSRLVEVGSPQTGFPWTTGGAWTVYAVWALTTAVLAVTSAQRRDQ
ncbi:ABC transporter permease [Streptomyces goshikiensis]|uniref:ABC transporter permease n=1 Tax=Streptomyces goshikiensis TaxID=1942 RepID=UPI0036B28C06